MKFYRIENDQNEGPYHNRNAEQLQEFLSKFDDFYFDEYIKSRPTPFSEGFKAFIKAPDSEAFIFGFSSKKKLVAWFTYSHEVEYFEKYDFKVSYYTSTEVFKSKNQSISKRENLTLIKRIDFKDFIDK